MKKLILLSALYGAFFGINTMKAQDADTKKSFLTTGVSINIPKEHSITHGIWRGEHIARTYTDRNGDA